MKDQQEMWGGSASPRPTVIWRFATVESTRLSTVIDQPAHAPPPQKTGGATGRRCLPVLLSFAMAMPSFGAGADRARATLLAQQHGRGERPLHEDGQGQGLAAGADDGGLDADDDVAAALLDHDR